MQLPEQINDFLAKAVLESQIGDVVKAAVNRSVVELAKSYNNPFDEVIKRHVVAIIEKEVLVTYQPTLEARVKEAMAKAMTDDAMEQIVKAAVARIGRA